MALTDLLSHLPGADYNTDVRPGLGGTFSDLVFGENVRQLTARSSTAFDDIYAHCWANANGTKILEGSASNGTLNIRSVPTGALLDSNVPGGTSGLYPDVIWHPTNPDKYLYLSGSSLMERSVGGSPVTVHTFPAALETLGGSVNWCDKTGKYFVIRWGGFGHVYNRDTDTVYTGDIPPATPTGWFGMSPSGNRVLSGATAPIYHTSYLINHGAQTVDTVGVPFWNNNGDHGVPVSGSDGKDYVIACDNITSPTQGLYRIDVTLDQSVRTEAQQIADNFKLLSSIGVTQSFHASHGPNGLGQDWVFMSGEDTVSGHDDFNQSPSSWYTGKQEIIAINYITGAVRRLAHHRSRSIFTTYYYQPRVSSAWDASLVMWGSNFNISTPSQYVDIYAIQNPLGALSDGIIPTPIPVPSRRMASWVRRSP